jgi:hypothetical protein
LIFSCAALALEWAETIISIHEGGRSNSAMMEALGSGGISKDYARLDAYQIRKESEKACKWGHPCPINRYECLFLWLVVEECDKHTELSTSQADRVRDCEAEFERLLKDKGYLEK